MLFKDQSDAEQYRMLSGPYQGEANMLLRVYVELLDRISKLAGNGPITITSYIRNNNIRSLHYWGRALDIRVKDKPKTWYWGMVEIGKGLNLICPRFRMNPHTELYGKEHQHIHIEIRDEKGSHNE